MFYLIFAIILLAFFLYIIRSLFSGLRNAEKLVAYFLSGSAYIILTLELASLFSWLDKPLAVLLIQFLFTTAFFWIFRKNISLPSRDSISTFYRSLVNQIKHHPYITVFTCLIAAGYGFLFFLSVHFPQNTGDSLYNHLSRIGYWFQQGSLKPYNGFNTIGITYPYNNSLLMLWSVLFIRSDVLVGSVQFIATIVCALIIYAISVEMGFENKRSLIAALIFLTFPIVLFQSITAQNDALAASFIGAAFLFMLKAVRNDDRIYLILSCLAYGLALGTKQYALFALPGYLALYLIVALKNRSRRLQVLSIWISSLVVFTILVGSYTYIQNALYHRSLLGEGREVNYAAAVGTTSSFIQKAVTNSARVATQFISCEGLPPDFEWRCLAVKRAIFRPIFINRAINIESSNFLLETGNPFSLIKPYLISEEAAWFGVLSWMILLPGMVYAVIYSIKKKRIEGIVLLLTALIFFVAIASFKIGWDPFLGRHLITTVILLMPFTVFIFGLKGWVNKTLLTVICSTSIFIAAFSIINNDSRPLLGKSQFYGKDWSEFTSLEKFAYKFLPLVKHDNNVWGESEIELKTYSDHYYLDPLGLVEELVPEDASLGIVAVQGYFYDYLFFGDKFSRKIIPIKNGDIIQQPDFELADYLLLTPDYSSMHPFGFKQIAEQNQWRILKRIR